MFPDREKTMLRAGADISRRLGIPEGTTKVDWRRVLDLGINDYLALLTSIGDASYFLDLDGSLSNGSSTSRQEMLDKIIVVYTYLRDQGAQTVGEALDKVSCGEVNPEIVRFWKDEGMYDDALEQAFTNAEILHEADLVLGQYKGRKL